MKILKISTLAFFVLTCIVSSPVVYGQDVPGQEPQEKPSDFSANFTLDVVSRYYFRGLLFSPTPNLQADVSVAWKGLCLGSWSSLGIGERYAEIDWYLSYTLGPVTLVLNDYFAENEDNILNRNVLPVTKYFDWNKDSTFHQLELNLIVDGPENFPLRFFASTFVFGADKKEDGKGQCFSTYLELLYPFRLLNHDFQVWVGGTPFKGFYYTSAHFTNIGFSVTHDLNITPTFKIPLTGTFAINPSVQDVFFIVGIRL